MLAFYLGLAITGVVLIQRSGAEEVRRMSSDSTTYLMFASLLAFCVWVVGVRVAFAIPHELRANWIFRSAELRRPAEYMAATRKALFALSVAPVWIGAAVLFFVLWPWQMATAHLLVLGLWGTLAAYACLYGFHKAPFAYSYVPGKSYVHMTALAAIGLTVLIGKGAGVERRALADPRLYAELVVALGLAAALMRRQTLTAANAEEAKVELEDAPPAAVLSLGLPRHAPARRE